jgi:hypothetical protein
LVVFSEAVADARIPQVFSVFEISIRLLMRKMKSQEYTRESQSGCIRNKKKLLDMDLGGDNADSRDRYIRRAAGRTSSRLRVQQAGFRIDQD